MELYIWLGEYESSSQRYLDCLPPGFDTICDDYDNDDEESSEAEEEEEEEVDDGEKNKGECERKLRPPIAIIYSGYLLYFYPDSIV